MSLAETEHEGEVGIPPARRPSAARIEPPLVGIPVEVEDARVAVGVGNWLHSYVEVVTKALFGSLF